MASWGDSLGRCVNIGGMVEAFDLSATSDAAFDRLRQEPPVPRGARKFFAAHPSVAISRACQVLG